MTLEERKDALTALVVALGACHGSDGLEAIVQILKASCGDGPSSFFVNLEEDAEWWADVASPIEVEAYVRAGIKRLCRMRKARNSQVHLARHALACLSSADRNTLLAEWGTGFGRVAERRG